MGSFKKRGKTEENNKRQREKRQNCSYLRRSFQDEVRIFFKTEMAGRTSLVSKAGNRMTEGVWSFIFSISFQPVSKMNTCPDECEEKANSIGTAITSMSHSFFPLTLQ